jgi:hypothetical protein
MKHLLTFFIIGILAVNISYSQAVSDRAVVPVSVTLNSILRLNVESGGNVEFNFNTIEQYENGISGLGSDDQYSTKITIASSVDWNLVMGAEDPYLVTSEKADTTGSNMPLDYIEYQITYTGTAGNSGDYTLDGTPTTLQQISGSTPVVIQPDGATTAGGINKNAFRIDWGCGVTTSLLGTPLTGGRYSTNVFFVLEPN